MPVVDNTAVGTPADTAVTNPALDASQIALLKGLVTLLGGSLTPGTAAANLGKAEDAVHASGDTGIFVLAVRKDTAAALAGMDGDYIPLIVDASGRLHVASELPDAAALADDAANPTTPMVGAAQLGFDGTAWDRLRTMSVISSSGSQFSTTGIPITGLAVQNGNTTAVGVQAAGSLTDGNAGLTSLPVAARSWNGASYDALRGNIAGTLLASAARTATTNSSDQTNYNGRGVEITLDVTVVPGGDTITLSIESKDPASGNYTTLLTGAAISTTGTRRYVLYPGVGAVANQLVSDILSRTWRVKVTHSAGTSFTYSVGYAVVL